MENLQALLMTPVIIMVVAGAAIVIGFAADQWLFNRKYNR